MDSALGWVGEIARWFASWIPRLVIIDTRNKCVKFIRGKHVRVVGPGLTIFWPIVTICEVWPVVMQPLVIDPQTLRTKDGKTIEVQCWIVYTISDLKTLITTIHEPDQGISDICLGAARQVVCTHTLEDLEVDHMATDRTLLSEIRKLVKPLGVNALRARFTSIAPVKAIKLFSSTKGVDSEVMDN